jgi:hypothetical protein
MGMAKNIPKANPNSFYSGRKPGVQVPPLIGGTRFRKNERVQYPWHVPGYAVAEAWIKTYGRLPRGGAYLGLGAWPNHTYAGSGFRDGRYFEMRFDPVGVEIGCNDPMVVAGITLVVRKLIEQLKENHPARPASRLVVF